MLRPRTAPTVGILVAFTALLAGCTSSLHSQVVIHAPPERVWSVLTDLEAYPEWNPFFVRIPWLFDGTHTFSIERIGAHTVRFTQHEDFAGAFVPLVSFQPYHQGWERMNAALKRRAEAQPAR